MEKLIFNSEQPVRLKKTYDYRDERGQLICMAKAEFEIAPPQKVMGQEYRRVLTSLLLSNDEVTIDVLAKANQHRAKILVAEKRQANYFGGDPVTIPPLETLLDIGTLLHELGHTDQEHDKNFRRVVELPRSFSCFSAASYEKLLQQLRDLNLYSLFKASKLQELKKLSHEKENRTASESSRHRYDELVDELDAPLRLILSQLPERDATYRAIRWMRQMRDQGINMFSRTKVPFVGTAESALLEHELVQKKAAGCSEYVIEAMRKEQDTTDVETDIVKDLQLALGTVKGQTRQMKRQYGKIPRADGGFTDT